MMNLTLIIIVTDTTADQAGHIVFIIFFFQGAARCRFKEQSVTRIRNK